MSVPDALRYREAVSDSDLFRLSREPALFPEQFLPLLEEVQWARTGFDPEEIERLKQNLSDAEDEIEGLRDDNGELQTRIDELRTELACRG